MIKLIVAALLCFAGSSKAQTLTTINENLWTTGNWQYFDTATTGYTVLGGSLTVTSTASASYFTGNGGGLTNITATNDANTVTSSFTILGAGGLLVTNSGIFSSTLTVQGNAFSVGGSTFVVSGGKVGIGLTTNCSTCTFQLVGGASISGAIAGQNFNGYVQHFANVDSDCTSSPCTITVGSPGITSITRSATGTYSVNFLTGAFTAEPACTVGAHAVGAPAAGFCLFGTPTNVSAPVYCYTASGSSQDDNFSVICMGAH